MLLRILASNLNLRLSKSYLNCCSSSKSFFSTTQATRQQLNTMSKYFLQDRYDNFSYSRLDYLSKKLSDDLLGSYDKKNLDGEKIAVLCSNNYTYLVSVIAIWKAGGVPLGLNKTYPINLLEYFINDSKCKLAINGMSDEDDVANNTALTDLLDKHKIVNYKLVENKFHLNSENREDDARANSDALENFRRLLNLEERKNKEAMILYTSGTSGPPKGVVLTCGKKEFYFILRRSS
jgi:malonyl-CoA/methylmalonyl-CoA synthetase